MLAPTLFVPVNTIIVFVIIFFIVLDMIKFIIRTNVDTYDRFYIGILNGLRN